MLEYESRNPKQVQLYCDQKIDSREEYDITKAFRYSCSAAREEVIDGWLSDDDASGHTEIDDDSDAEELLGLSFIEEEKEKT